MIRMIRDSGSEVLLIAVPEPGLFPSAASFYSDVARETGTPIILSMPSRIFSRALRSRPMPCIQQVRLCGLAQAIMTKLQERGRALKSRPAAYPWRGSGPDIAVPC
ncbi:MAG: hypothetical protein U5P41_16285 [Gammaproteobacteria bacterium]|nr:hypothetical protein [Gammaproteobacteria bacterium]